MSNSFGDLFKVTIFGESHGKAMGGIVDGCVPGLVIDEEQIRKELLRRSTAKNFFSSPREESDEIEILSGVKNGKTNGLPISFIIRNTDQKDKDYDELDNLFRPSHADFTYFAKYGSEESAGKLNASGRIFAPVVIAGSIAKQFLATKGISILAYVDQIGNITEDDEYNDNITFEDVEKSMVRCPYPDASNRMISYLKTLIVDGDTAGGIIRCFIRGCEPGLGDPIFDKLSAKLAHAMLSIHSVRGFEFGTGFSSTEMTGSEVNDEFITKNNKLVTSFNHSGGIQGGISNGMEIDFQVAFKPISSIAQSQKTINRQAQEVEFTIEGRHDVCIVPRAVPIVEAMAALVIADSYLKNLPYAENI
jgi:chorismate synthase